jgi:hypothetical protein
MNALTGILLCLTEIKLSNLMIELIGILLCLTEIKFNNLITHGICLEFGPHLSDIPEVMIERGR